jgi:hypothetical protein
MLYDRGGAIRGTGRRDQQSVRRHANFVGIATPETALVFDSTTLQKLANAPAGATRPSLRRLPVA